jgi:hypothetical protein
MFESFYQRFFELIENMLLKISKLTGLTYNEINVLLYYLIIPFSWILLLDRIFRFHYLKISFLIVYLAIFIICKDFKAFSDILFNKSSNFLLYFDKIGSNYYKSSVWICIILPLIVYTLLFYFVFSK